MAFPAFAHDLLPGARGWNETIIHHDGEIRAARWFTAAELREAIALFGGARQQRRGRPRKLELPGTNAVARRMIDEWSRKTPVIHW